MPEISIRISASSSTIRMSCAIATLFLLSFFDGYGRRGDFNSGNNQADPGADALRAVLKLEFTAMVLHDLLDDGEPQAGALGSRGDVGLGQPVPFFLRQALAVVGDN